MESLNLLEKLSIFEMCCEVHIAWQVCHYISELIYRFHILADALYMAWYYFYISQAIILWKCQYIIVDDR